MPARLPAMMADVRCQMSDVRCPMFDVWCFVQAAGCGQKTWKVGCWKLDFTKTYSATYQDITIFYI